MVRFSLGVAQDYVLNYQHIQTKDGLANAFVNCALQDQEGFMWFGTNDGLCRYDGREFRTYRNNEEDSVFLGSNAIQSIFQLNQRYLLIGTRAGLSEMDLYTQKFSTIEFFDKKNIISIFLDSKKTIWIVANDQLFFKENDTKKWKNYAEDFPSFSKKIVTGIYEKMFKEENYLIVSEAIDAAPITIAQLSYKTHTEKKWKKIAISPFTSTYFKENEILFSFTTKTQKYASLHQEYDTSLFKVRRIENVFNISDKLGLPFSSEIEFENNLYSYNSEGVFVINTQNKQISKFIDWSKTSLKTDKYGIIGIYKDNTDNLWVYTHGAGIAVVPMYTLFSLKEYKYRENEPSKSLSGASVRTVYQDNATKNIWIASYNEERKVDIFTPKKNKKSLSCISVPYLFRPKLDDASELYLGTYNGVFSIKTNNTNASFKSLEQESQVHALLPLNDSTVWMAKKYFLQKYNLLSNIETTYPQYDKVNCLYLDKNKRVWLGSLTNGIALLDTTQQTPTFYNPNKNAKNSNCKVMAIHQGSKGFFWIATTDGMYSFDEKTKSFKNYTEQNGLPNNTVYAILEDEKYNLWLSTNYGISKFDIEKETFENYDESDGLQNNEFNQKAYFKNAEGELFFGGINGLNVFFPKDMKRNNFVPPLYLTQIKKQDSVIHFSKPLQQVKELRLPIDDVQILTFDFVALNYYRPEKNQYAYKIDELQNDWVNLGNKGKLTLTGLAHGNYTLRIKASNNHGVWNEEGIILKLVLIPPVYLQNWFLISGIILFLISVYLVYKWRMYQVKKNEKLLEEQIQNATQALANKNILFEKQNKALEKANTTQNQLFAIIAHDLRSPLTAFQDISTQINYFLKKNNPEALQELGGYIDTSVQNLNNLLNNLLNWALTQQHQIKHQPQNISLKNTLEEIKNIYQTLSQSIGIEIDIKVNTDLTVYVDKDSFQTIIRNLVSNALKFTPKNGKITLLANPSTSPNEVILKISDTGIGMDEVAQREIFELNLAHTRKGLRGEKSTGLGLVLCYEFAQMNNIDIKIESQINEGTTFILTIPRKEN